MNRWIIYSYPHNADIQVRFIAPLLKDGVTLEVTHSLLSHSCRRSPGAGGPTVQVHEH